MSPEQLAAFALFAAVSSITPGPNNTMVLASGVRFGFARTLPHLAGIVLGFAALVAGCALGLHAVLARWPALALALRVAAVLYLAWMAWKLATAPVGPVADARTADGPLGFWAAAAFQWVNPKAWVMALGAVTAFLPAGAALPQVALLVLVFAAVNAPCVASWAAFGSALRRVLQRPRARRAFNIAMAVLLIASLIPLLRG